MSINEKVQDFCCAYGWDFESQRLQLYGCKKPQRNPTSRRIKINLRVLKQDLSIISFVLIMRLKSKLNIHTIAEKSIIHLLMKWTKIVPERG